MRPAQSSTMTPSMVRVLSLSCTRALLPTEIQPEGYLARPVCARDFRLRRGYFWAEPWGARASRIIRHSRHELPGPGPEIPSAEVLRSHRPGARYTDPQERHRTGAHGSRVHFQRAPGDRQDYRGPHPGHGIELPVLG